MSTTTSRNHRSDNKVSERRLRAAIPTAVNETAEGEQFKALLAKRARRPKEAYDGERRDLARYLADMLVKRQGETTTEIADIARAALVLNDLRLSRAIAAVLARDDAHTIAEGNLRYERAQRGRARKGA